MLSTIIPIHPPPSNKLLFLQKLNLVKLVNLNVLVNLAQPKKNDNIYFYCQVKLGKWGNEWFIDDLWDNVIICASCW